MLVVGVDPGLHGAIAFLDPRTGKASANVMPLLGETERDQYDVPQLRLLLASRGRDSVVFLERLMPMPPMFKRAGGGEVRGGGVITNYNRGKATWLFVGLCSGLGIECRLVLPQAWQRSMLEGAQGEDTKARSVWAAQRLFPSVSLLEGPRCRKPHDGLADALMLAEFGRRQLAGDRGRQRGLLEVGGAA